MACSENTARSTPEKHDVAVIVPTRNRKETTLRFLRQLESQSYSGIHTIVIDSNSKDGTQEAIRISFPEAELIKASDHDYWAGATNKGVQRSLELGHDWILTINDDAVISETHIESLMRIATRNGCKILGSQINYLSEPDRIWAAGTSCDWNKKMMLRLNFHNQDTTSIVSNLPGQEVMIVDSLPGNGVLIHRSVFERVGLYNSCALPHYHADSELIMRAAAHGITAWVTTEVILYNDFSEEQKNSPVGGVRGAAWLLFNRKSYLYLPPLIYIIFKYCPASHKTMTFISMTKALCTTLAKKAFTRVKRAG